MSGLSRRQFVAAVGVLAGAWALPSQLLGRALAAARVPANVPTTLLQTIRFGPVVSGRYHSLRAAPGEPFIERLDLLGKAASPARAAARRSLCYLGHFSDLHVIDAQSPARLEPMLGLDPSSWAGAFRPHDALTMHVNAAMVEAMTEARRSPVTGAAMSAAVVTGDSTDMLSHLELDWYVGVLDGRTITPNSGALGVYEGVQAWAEATYAWHPDDPNDAFGALGYPRQPGMLTAAVSQPIESVGLAVPWYTVFGNHDTLYIGTLPVSEGLEAWALGDRKAALWPALGLDSFRGLAADASPFTALLGALQNQHGLQPGIRSVTADPARALFDQTDFMQAHLDSPALPGPVGHGFTPAHVESGQTWWSADVGPFVRLLGLDTCNSVIGADGAVPEEQFEWLKAELTRAAVDRKLAIVLSHHNSFSLQNPAMAPGRESQRLVFGDEFVAKLLEFPHLIAWVNGHSHINGITAHSREGGGGFWELTTASCIDFPQQQQLVEVVDNRDGSLSIFSTVIDHLSPVEYRDGDFSATGLASLSRQLSANDAAQTPVMRMGSPLDRNCELLLPAPFDLSTLTDAEVEAAQLAAEARLVAYEQRGTA